MKQVKTARGKIIDMSALAKKHEFDRAVSNVPMNAKGDRLDANGKIQTSVQTITRVQHDNPVVRTDVPLSNPTKPTPKKNKTAAATETPVTIVSTVTKTRSDGVRCKEIEYSDGSIEVIELPDGGDDGDVA